MNIPQKEEADAFGGGFMAVIDRLKGATAPPAPPAPAAPPVPTSSPSYASLNATAARGNSTMSRISSSPAEPQQQQQQQQMVEQYEEAEESGGGPPPPPPGPPPPPSMSGAPKAAAPGGRADLLSSIEGFSKNGLKKGTCFFYYLLLSFRGCVITDIYFIHNLYLFLY